MQLDFRAGSSHASARLRSTHCAQGRALSHLARSLAHERHALCRTAFDRAGGPGIAFRVSRSCYDHEIMFGNLSGEEMRKNIDSTSVQVWYKGHIPGAQAVRQKGVFH